MADLSQHTNYTAAYSGLLDNFYLTLGIAGACLIGYEIEVHIPRRRGKDGRFQRIPVRVYHALRGMWGWGRGEGKAELGARESWEFGYVGSKCFSSGPSLASDVGGVFTAGPRARHASEVRLGFDFTCEILKGVIVLMPLHIIYSPSDVARTSMLRASISSLVQSSGSRWLWVHALLIWWISITWTATALWITWGGLAYRRRELKLLEGKVKAARAAKREVTRGEDGEDRFSVGEDCEGIKKFRSLMVTNVPPDMRDENVLRDYFDYYLHRHYNRREQTSQGTHVDEVILVRKLGTLISLRSRRHDVLKKLEVAHVNLAKKVLAAVEKDRKGGKREGQLEAALGRFLDGPQEDTVWDALHGLPRELIDPFQSLTHLTSLFRNQNAPLIDYLTTKLNYLTVLLEEAKNRPLESYPAASTAFVTFKDAKSARLAHKILDSHPKRSLACHTAHAPDWTDLLWPRLGKSVYRSEFVRGWAVYLGVWAFTLVWIFPVSLLCALASLTNIAGFIKPLAGFLAAHPKVASAITSLAPVILVALLTIAICPILLVIANKAETIVTRLGIHNSVLERFWKFLMVNGVVFFAIGQSAIEAYLTAFQNNDFDPLPIVASAFPTAAPYFASYILLQTAIQPFFEIFRFGLPTIVYVFGTRVSTIPRQRSSRTEHPTFSHFSQVPQQLLAGAIMHLFMLLNPLVLPFTLVYYGACYLVWKRQFTYVYGRLYETNGRRTSVRVVRYSLDALALAQFVLFAFFILSKAKGHAISTGILVFITLVSKLIITRALKRRFDSLDVQEADLLCPAVDAIEASDEDVADDVSVTHPSSRFHTLRKSLHQWNAQRKPIPFEHALFATLDSKIEFEVEEGVETSVSEGEAAAVIEPQAKLVVPHPPLQPWEDIPPYQRARGYNDQPAYTDDYDDFLWLPRDPLSTLDLDDTVELRSSLTTSAGAGEIGEWVGGLEDEALQADVGEVFGRPRSDSAISLQDLGMVPEPTAPIPGHVSFPATLGRSPSGRRPSRLRSGSGLGTELLRSRSQRDRSMSVLSSRSSSAISAQQQALISEVMEEERLAHKDAKKEQLDEQAKDEEELMKERRKSNAEGLRRSVTREGSEKPMIERGSSQRSQG
nr:uncharacterized protein CI109_003639 [Kwoniella shandongensis]KAA5527984.1 hypothetical protein CI109_003639 [Kwoniella shandongensis]